VTPDEARQAYSARPTLAQPLPEGRGRGTRYTVAGPLGPIAVRLYRPAGTVQADVLRHWYYYHGAAGLLGISTR